MLKPSGHRLDDKHNSIIRKWAKTWNVEDAKALRRIIEDFDRLKKMLLLPEKSYESK